MKSILIFLFEYQIIGGGSGVVLIGLQALFSVIDVEAQLGSLHQNVFIDGDAVLANRYPRSYFLIVKLVKIMGSNALQIQSFLVSCQQSLNDILCE